MAWSRFPKRSKMGNTRIDYEGHSFASKFEASVFQQYRLREKAGEIKNLRCQVQVRMTDAGIIYKPDFAFEFCANDQTGYGEAKGFKTPEWKLKLRLWKSYGPGKLEIWEGTYIRPKLTEVVMPCKTRDVCPECQSAILDRELGLSL